MTRVPIASLLCLGLALWAPQARAAAPAWASRDTQRLDGKIFRVVCSGTGPSIGFARQSAIDSCKVSAAQMLNTDITVKSMSVTSESQAAYEQEVVNESQVEGLSCNPRHEESEDDGSEVRLWLLCEFDLSKARIVRAAAPNRRPDSDVTDDWEARRQHGFLTDERKVLTLAVVPSCHDVIIQGDGPAREIQCGGRNLVSVVLSGDDREILVRKKGYLPKTVFLGPERAARGYVQVLLEPNP